MLVSILEKGYSKVWLEKMRGRRRRMPKATNKSSLTQCKVIWNYKIKSNRPKLKVSWNNAFQISSLNAKSEGRAWSMSTSALCITTHTTREKWKSTGRTKHRTHFSRTATYLLPRSISKRIAAHIELVGYTRKRTHPYIYKGTGSYWTKFISPYTDSNTYSVKFHHSKKSRQETKLKKINKRIKETNKRAYTWCEFKVAATLAFFSLKNSKH